MPRGVYERTVENTRNMVGFKVGHVPWHKGKTCPSISASKLGVPRPQVSAAMMGSGNHMFGRTRHRHHAWIDGVPTNILTLHDRIRMLYGSPDVCEGASCRGTSTKYEWSNKDHKYDSTARDRWQRLCHGCHEQYDIEHNNKQSGISARK